MDELAMQVVQGNLRNVPNRRFVSDADSALRAYVRAPQPER